MRFDPKEPDRTDPAGETDTVPGFLHIPGLWEVSVSSVSGFIPGLFCKVRLLLRPVRIKESFL